MFNVFVNTTAKIINAMGLMSINMETQYLQIVGVGLVRMASQSTELFVWSAVGTETKFQINHNILILVKLTGDKIAVINPVVAVKQIMQDNKIMVVAVRQVVDVVDSRGVSRAVAVEVSL